MKKLGSICLILLLTVLLWSFSKAFPFLRKACAQHPTPSGQIHQGLTAVNTGMVNFYVISHGETRICIDAGSSRRRAEKELAKLEISPATITAVFLTHSDQDHIAALSLFPNARIYLSHTEAEMVHNKERRLFGLIGNKLPSSYHTVSDGEEVNVGGIRVKAIATPGHTTGSTSYLVNGDTLFTGDTLSLIKGKVGIFAPRVFNMDEKTQAASIRRLKSLPNIKFLCTGHHGVTTDFAAALAEWE